MKKGKRSFNGCDYFVPVLMDLHSSTRFFCSLFYHLSNDRLRHLLTQGGFRLPGEAQQIDRLISTFARCYWEDNAGDLTNCPIEDEGVHISI